MLLIGRALILGGMGEDVGRKSGRGIGKEEGSVFGFEGINFRNRREGREIFLDSSMVEHSAVNRVVVGSSPTRGVKLCEEGESRRHGEEKRETAPWSSG